jgi:lysophospholipase L1-like esterase
MKKILIIILLIIVLLGVIGLARHSHSNNQVAAVHNQNYVALGDSVSAGVGLETYSDSSACDRTNQSYPNLVSSTLGFNLTNLSCSGATIPSGILGQQDVNNLNLTPQLNQLFTEPKPTLISLTIGANDIGWTNFISKCYAGVCGSDADTAAVNSTLAVMSGNLKTTLNDIQNNYKTNIPDVIVTSYYQVFPATFVNNCTDMTGINATELGWLRSQQQSLNSAIQNTVAGYSFIKFANINFTGHELCTSDSWVQGLNDGAPFHPTDDGQKEFANQIISTYRTFK